MSIPHFWPLSVFLSQAVLMIIDEFYFHRKRGLPRWERWGHPLDTVTGMIPFVIVLFDFQGLFAYSETLFIIAAAISCLFVTKDELMHTKFCGYEEHWLHALLFMLHPLLFLALWTLWHTESGAAGLDPFFLVQVQLSAMFIFLIYQIVYWNFIWKQK